MPKKTLFVYSTIILALCAYFGYIYVQKKERLVAYDAYFKSLHAAAQQLRFYTEINVSAIKHRAESYKSKENDQLREQAFYISKQLDAITNNSWMLAFKKIGFDSTDVNNQYLFATDILSTELERTNYFQREMVWTDSILHRANGNQAMHRVLQKKATKGLNERTQQILNTGRNEQKVVLLAARSLNNRVIGSKMVDIIEHQIFQEDFISKHFKILPIVLLQDQYFSAGKNIEGSVYYWHIWEIPDTNLQMYVNKKKIPVTNSIGTIKQVFTTNGIKSQDVNILVRNPLTEETNAFTKTIEIPVSQ